MARQPKVASAAAPALSVFADQPARYDDVQPTPLDRHYHETLATTRKGRESVLKVLEATKSVLETDGYANMTLRLVAERAGIAHASLQHYFPTKDKLLEGFMLYATGLYRDEIKTIFSSYQDDPAGKFRAYARFYLEDVGKPAVRTIFYEIRAIAQHSAFIAKALDDMYVRYRRRIDLMLHELNPALTPDVRALRAAMIVGLIDGLVPFMGDNGGGHPELAALAKTAEDEIMRIATAP